MLEHRASIPIRYSVLLKVPSKHYSSCSGNRASKNCSSTAETVQELDSLAESSSTVFCNLDKPISVFYHWPRYQLTPKFRVCLRKHRRSEERSDEGIGRKLEKFVRWGGIEKNKKTTKLAGITVSFHPGSWSIKHLSRLFLAMPVPHFPPVVTIPSSKYSSREICIHQRSLVPENLKQISNVSLFSLAVKKQQQKQKRKLLLSHAKNRK